MDALVNVLSGVVTARVRYNDQYLPLRDVRQFTIFHRAELPPISLEDYLVRMAKYGEFSPSCMLLGLYYIDRLALNDQRFLMTSFNVNRMLITAITLASKYLDDACASIRHFAELGGIGVDELVMQEADMVRRLEFRLHMSTEEYGAYHRRMSEEFLRVTYGVRTAEKVGSCAAPADMHHRRQYERMPPFGAPFGTYVPLPKAAAHSIY